MLESSKAANLTKEAKHGVAGLRITCAAGNDLPGFGNEPGDSLEGNRWGWFGALPSFAAESKQDCSVCLK